MTRIYTNILCLLIFAISLNAQTIAYHPNSHWHVKGSLPGKSENKYTFNDFSPQYSFPYRFENGAWHSEEWKSWKKENGFSHAYPLVGHSWQAVIQRNKETFQKHPEYLALVNGKRPGYGKTTKLCVSNKALQALFIADRLAAFSELNNTYGSISVEPSDGPGFCECEGCKRLGSISNQVFTLANLTAKALKARFPSGKVNLYAYYKHAAIPDFDLESNIHVTVIPDGYQQVYNGDAMISLWAEKAKHLTYYEYFGIPQQKGELPRLRMQNYLRRMKLAQRLGYEGFWFETGMNINTAIALQLFNQLWTYRDVTWEQVSENFLKSSFAGSYEPMKRLFTRWWHTWLEEEEIPLALNDLQQASLVAKSSEELERINDLKAYVHYIALYQEWNKDLKNNYNRKALFDYIYSSSSRMIVNANALSQVFGKYLSPDELKQYKVRGKLDWHWVKPLTSAQIENNFKSDLRRYGIKQSSFTFQSMEDEIKDILKTNAPVHNWELTNKFSDHVFLYVEKDLFINMRKLRDFPAPGDDQLFLTLMDNNGKFIAKTSLSNSKPNIRIPLPKPGIYSLAITQYFSANVELNGMFIPILIPEQVTALQKKLKTLKNNKTSSQGKEKNTKSNGHYYYYITR